MRSERDKERDRRSDIRYLEGTTREKKLCTQVCRRRSDVFVGRGRIEGQGRYYEQRVVERERERERKNQHWRRVAIIRARNGERWSVVKIS